MICCLLLQSGKKKQRSLVMTCYRWLLFISISVSVVKPFCSSFNIKWWETSESLGERKVKVTDVKQIHSMLFIFVSSEKWANGLRHALLLSLCETVPSEIVKKFGCHGNSAQNDLLETQGTWLHEIESHYLNFHQYCVRDSLFIPLGRLHLKWSLWDVWTHQARIMLTSPRGTQRGLVFILGSIWCSGMITAVSHHPVLSCLGCYARAHSQMHSGDTFNILEHLDRAYSHFECI